MKQFLLFIFCIMIVLQSIAQKTQHTDFLQFINHFLEVRKFPIKSKNNPIFQSIPDNVLSVSETKQYLGLNDQILSTTKYTDYQFNHSTQQNNLSNLPYALFRIMNHKYVVLVYSHMNATDTGEILVGTLKTFTRTGKPLDSIMVFGNLTNEVDWRSFVLLNKRDITILKYGYNMKNYTIKNGIYSCINIDNPKTIVEIINYKINKYGIIKQVGAVQKKYLQGKVVDYRNDGKGLPDDPINSY